MIKQYLIIAATMLLADVFWLSFRYKYHINLIKSVQHAEPVVRIIPAMLIYVLLPATVLYFVVLSSKNIKTAAINGFLLGASVYGVYDLTNLATLKNWTVEMSVIDTLWGAILCSLGACVGKYF